MRKGCTKPLSADARRAEEVAAWGATNAQIAGALGVSETTLKRIRGRDPAVDDAILNGKARADLLVVGALYAKALAGDVTAMIYWLKNRQPDQWRERRDGDGVVQPSLIVVKYADEVVDTNSTAGAPAPPREP